MKMTNVIQWLGLAAAAVAGLWVEVPVVYQALIVFIVLDVLAGGIRAGVNHELSSDAAFTGMLKKGGELILVGMSFYVQKLVPGFESVPLPAALAGFYCYVETISILENSAALGVPIPAFLKNALASLSPDKVTPGNPNQVG